MSSDTQVKIISTLSYLDVVDEILTVLIGYRVEDNIKVSWRFEDTFIDFSRHNRIPGLGNGVKKTTSIATMELYI